MARRLATLVLLAVALAPSNAQQHPRLILISIDGMMPSSYQSDASGATALRGLAAKGAWAEAVTGVWPTNTRPSHATILTGVQPAVHGIVENFPLDPEGTLNPSFNWFARDIRVPTLVTAARAAGRSTAVLGWPLSVGMDVNYLVPSFNWQYPRDQLLLRSLSTPRLLDDFERAIGSPFDWPPSEAQRAALTTFIERTYRPDVMLLYFGTHDAFQHTYGPGAEWTAASLRDIDRLIATILAALDAQKLLEETFVAVVSDHGYIEVEHAVSPNVALMQAGLIEKDARGRTVAWQAYSHGEGGSSLVYVKERSNEALVARVRAMLDALRGDPQAGIDRVLDHDELVAAGADPEATFGLEMKPGYSVTQDTHSLFQPPYIKAMHGYPPRHPEMNASFIITGPGMKGVGNIGTVRLTQVGPTLAHLLGLTLSAQADAPIDKIMRAAR